MTWRIDETAIFGRVAHYFRKPALDEGEREAVRAITSRVAGESEEITPDAVLAAIRDAERRAGERSAALQAGRRPPESEIPEVEVAVLAALDHFAAGEAHTTLVLHLAGTHRSLRELEAGLRVPQPAAVRLQGEPTAGSADAIGIELRSPHIRTPPPPPETPQGRDAGPLIGPALWAQVFRDSHLVADPEDPGSFFEKPGAQFRDTLTRREVHPESVRQENRQRLVKFLASNIEPLISKVSLLDFGSLLDEVERGVVYLDDVPPTHLVAHARAGGDNFLARILDGFVAVSLMQKYPWALQKGKALDIQEHYFPLWYSLRSAMDAAESLGGEAGRSLRVYFKAKLKKLDASYRNLVGHTPPAFDWKRLSKVPRHMMETVVPEVAEWIEKGVETIPPDFPMVRVGAHGRVPLEAGLTRPPTQPTPSPTSGSRIPPRETVSNRYLNALIAIYEAGPPPDDLVPAPRRGEGRDYLSTLPDSPFASEAGSVLGDNLSRVVDGLRGLLDYPEGDGKRRLDQGIDVLARSTMVPETPKVTSQEEAVALRERVMAEEIHAANAYEDDQLGRMPTAQVHDAYRAAQRRIITAYEKEDPVIQAYLRKVEEIGGRPDPSAWNRASWKLDQTISNNAYLQLLGIGPQEFQILLKRRDYETWTGGETERNFLRARYFGQERMYVLSVLTHVVTRMINEKKPVKAWQEIEDLAARSIDLYDRLTEGKVLRSSDKTLLARIRAIAFPFEIPDWNDTRLSDVKQAMDKVQRERGAFAEKSRQFMMGMAEASVALNRAAEESSMEREAADFEFQKVRLEAEFRRLLDEAARQGATVSESDQVYFRERYDAYVKLAGEYRTFWENFATGNDVTAREHARNAKDKNTLFALAFGAQWALFELYSKYQKERGFGPDDARILPSCLSLSYVNSLRIMDEAVKAGRISSQGIQSFFDSLFAHFPEAISILGLEIPFVRVRVVKGRRVLDLQFIDAIASNVGAGSITENARIVVHGLGPVSNLFTNGLPHPAVARLAGAQATYSAGFFGVNDVSNEAALIRSNHTGIQEFWRMVTLGLWGIDAPQQAQGGAANAIVMGDYVRARTVVIERSMGSNEANKKIMAFLMRGQHLLSFTSGTRIVTAGGKHPFTRIGMANGHELLVWRNTSDRQTSGQDAKILLAMQEEAGATGIDLLVVNLVHDGSLACPEPTWFLSNDPVDVILGNFGARTSLNFGPRPVAANFLVGLALSSNGYLPLEVWEGHYPHLFVTADGKPMSGREKYVQALQLNAAVMTAAMRMDVASLDLSAEPEATPEQVALQRDLQGMSAAERKEATIGPLDRGMRGRLERIGKAREARGDDSAVSLPPHLEAIRESVVHVDPQPVLDDLAQDTKRDREELGPLSAEEAGRLDAILPRERALAAIAGVIKVEKDRGERWRKGEELIVEALQRGASVAKRFKDRGLSASALALDLDKVVWDHFFVVSGGGTMQLLEDELMAPFDVPGADSRFKEVISINPQWLAFIIGYAEVFGVSPTLFSSTFGPRLALIARHVDTNPLVKRFFEVVLGEKDLTSRRAVQRLSQANLERNPRIITRDKISRHVVSLLTRFRENNYSFEGFSDDERADIKTILRTKGDVHFKLRSLVPYVYLVDDREENAREAAAYDGVTAFQPEPLLSPSEFYLATDTETHISQRLNRGRSGSALALMRLMEDPESEGRLVVVGRRDAPAKIPQLRDAAVSIEYGPGEVRDHYRGPKKAARDAAKAVLRELKERELSQKKTHLQAKKRLAEILRDERTFGTVEVPPIRITNALSLLETKDPKKGELNGESDIEMIEWPLRRIPDETLREEAMRQVAILKDRSAVKLYAEVIPPRKKGGIGRILKEAQKLVGKNLPSVLNLVSLSVQHGMGASLEEEFEGWTGMLRIFGSRENFLLARLSYHMRGEEFPIPGFKTMSVEEQIEGYGIAVERVGKKLAVRLLDKLAADPDTPERLKRELADHRPEIEKLIDELVASARQVTVHAGMALYHAGEAFKHGKDFLETAGELIDGPAGEAASAQIKAWARGIIDKIAGSPWWEKVGEWSNRLDGERIDTNSRVLSAMMAGLVDMIGSDTLVGELLNEANDVLVDKGFGHLVKEAMKVKKRLDGVLKYKEAQLIADKMEEGDAEGAEEILLRSAQLMVAKIDDEEKALQGFRSLAESAWILVQPEHRDTVKAMVHRVYHQVFEKEGTPGGGPGSGADGEGDGTVRQRDRTEPTPSPGGVGSGSSPVAIVVAPPRHGIVMSPLGLRVVRGENPQEETGRAVEVMIALAGAVGLADQYAAYRQRGGKVSDLLRLASKVKAWLVSQGIQAEGVPLIYLALGAFVIRASDEPKRAYLKIVASYAASRPTAPAAAVPGVPAWAVPGALPAQVIPVPVN